jgi:hypothetical protein
VCGGRAIREPNRLFSAKWTENYSFGGVCEENLQIPPCYFETCGL